MVLEGKEDQTAPVSEATLHEAIQSGRDVDKFSLIKLILRCFNQKRDAYNGVVSSVIYVIDSQDTILVQAMKDGLCASISSNPMMLGGKMFVTKSLPRMVEERPNFVIELFEQLIDSSPIWSKNFQDRSEILKIQIIAIKAIRQAEQSVGGRPTKIQPELIEQLSVDAIYNCDDRTKIDTLSLMLASRSTSKPVEDKELTLFKVLFQDALSLQEPALRQIFLSQTSKLMIRLVDSIRVVMREVGKGSYGERNAIYTRYNQFLSWLVTFCFDSIYCNAYFGSFILTMSTLKLIIKHVTFNNPNLNVKSLFEQRRCYDSVLSCLTDSFEENKSAALELLLSLPYNEEFINEINISQFETIAYQLATSVNPAHSLTCLYVFRLVIGLRSRQTGCIKSKNQILREHLSRLIDIVEENVEDTRDNFISALKHKSIYPKLTCIRALLNDIEIKTLEEDRKDWEILVKRIIAISIDACQAVSSIVCNLNPETIGHLPMDLKPVDVESLAKALNVSLKMTDAQANSISSQMLLISGWKTIKECSLSLGALCVRMWWPKGGINEKREKFPGLKTDPILGSEEIVKIVGFFDHYLRNLRHRGAFEQAYNGFIMVTRRVWHDEHYRSLLIDSLNQILGDFRNEALDLKRAECLKAYVTRRSAGLPFLVQAICNSEHKHESKTLRSVMECLFEVLDSGKSEEYQRIHCLNILRALVKEHFLGEKMLIYVGKTFEISIESFRSDSFPIRNCANMLLKAAVDRTFGINRLRDDIHRRNQLSFERFFTECPDLHPKMLKILEDGLANKKYLAAVHAVFIVLFRLKPSLNPSEKYKNDKVIVPFIRPLLELAYNCPDYKLRELAAKLAVRYQGFCLDHECNSGELEKQIITELEQNLMHPKESGNNKLHGTVLLIKNWLHCSSDRDGNQFFACAQRAVDQIFLKRYTSSEFGYPIKNAALDMVEVCCLKRPRSVKWLSSFYSWCLNLHRKSYQDNLSLNEPPELYHESVLFKTACLLLMSASDEGLVEGRQHQHPRLVRCNELIQILPGSIRLAMEDSNGLYSSEMQASLIRLLRQRHNGSSQDFVSKVLIDKLDMDMTASHMTAFDKLKLMTENDAERDEWLEYCQRFNIVGTQYDQDKELFLRTFFEFRAYDEFYPMDRCFHETFSTKRSNTARAIELLIFAYQNWDEFNLTEIAMWTDYTVENTTRRLKFLTRFVSQLADCDVKCLAVLCASKLMIHEVRETDMEKYLRLEALEDFSQLICDLVDGGRSLTMRLTCTEVLKGSLRLTIQRYSNCRALQKCLMSLLSALIKLSQDEEYEVRLYSQRVIRDLHDLVPSDQNQMPAQGGNHLNQLIRLIVTKIFDPNQSQEMNHCFELLMRIIFNHSRDYSNNLDDEKERLFDKTKLNTFSDHVATIQTAIEGLRLFFKGRKVSLKRWKIPPEIVVELKRTASPGHSAGDTTGDYSWRLKREKELAAAPEVPGQPKEEDNHQIVDDLFSNILEYLDYFAKGYVNVLKDTDYTTRELSLFKNMAFIKFVVDCTDYDFKNSHVIDEIQDSLNNIIHNSCSTTILCRVARSLKVNSRS